MASFIETLEPRALLSASTISADGEKLLGDLITTHADVVAAVSLFHADAAAIKADIKALPKNATNTTDLAKVKAVEAAAVAVDTRDVVRLVLALDNDVKQGVGTYLSFLAKPTAAKLRKLGKLINATTTLATPYVQKLDTDIAAGVSKIDAALGALAAANPTAPTLASDLQTAETDQTTESATLQADGAVVQQDVTTYATDLTELTGL